MMRNRPWLGCGPDSGRRRSARPRLEALEGRELLAAVVRIFPIPAFAPAIVAGHDGNLWFTQRGQPDEIGRLSTSGTLTEFPLSTSNSVSDLTAAPDGDIWFIQANNAEVGRITPDGTVTEFPLPAADVRVTAIAAGPDGNIWVAEATNQTAFQNQIPLARIAPDGTITQMGLPPAPGANSSYPSIYTLAVGPDGDIWYGAANGYMGHMTVSGSVSYVPLFTTAPFTTDTEVVSIVPGQGGDVWFLAYTAASSGITVGLGLAATASRPERANTAAVGGGDVVGHLAADGSMTTFPTSLDPGTMIMGPDGDLWITQEVGYMAAYVERVTPSGSFSKFTTQIHPNRRKDVALATGGITTGPDGNLWIAEAPGEHGPGVTAPGYEIVQLVVAQSTPDRTPDGHKAGQGRAASHLHPNPKHPGKAHKPESSLGYG